MFKSSGRYVKLNYLQIHYFYDGAFQEGRRIDSIYISNNPVKAQMCNNSLDYKYNSLKFLFNKIYDFAEPPNSLLQLFIPGITGLLPE